MQGKKQKINMFLNENSRQLKLLRPCQQIVHFHHYVSYPDDHNIQGRIN